MDNIKELLKKIDGVPETDDIQELGKWLKTRDSQIGKMQQTLSKTSDRYVSLKAERELVEAALKLLRKKVKEEKKKEEQQEAVTSVSEEGGLVAGGSYPASEEGGIVAGGSYSVPEEGGIVANGSTPVQKEKNKQVESSDALYRRCADIMQGDDSETKKQMYKKISVDAENGNADAIAILGRINDIEGKFMKAGRLWDMSADMGSALGCYLRAYCYYYGKAKYGFEENGSKAYGDYGKYLEIKKNLNLSEKFDRIAFLRFYKLALILDKQDGKCNRTKDCEIIKQNLSKLWNSTECPEEAKVEALTTMGDILAYRKQYTDSISHYLKAGWDESVDKILEIFYQIEDRQIREKLEARIIQTREDKNTSNEVRGVIYYWYGQRYESGKDVVPDKTKSFLYYWGAEKCGSKKGKSKRINLLMTAVEKMDFLAEDFLISIGEEGYWDAYKYMGDRYEKLFGIDNYRKAQEYYIKGQNGTMKAICEEMCNKLTERINNATIYNKAVEYLGTDRCIEAFDQLKKLAKQGFAEACYKVAEISEGNDRYTAVKLQGYLLDDHDIRDNYRKAATAGIRPAIERMVDIYSQGLFGANRDLDMCKKWKERLAKL